MGGDEAREVVIIVNVYTGGARGSISGGTFQEAPLGSRECNQKGPLRVALDLATLMILVVLECY